MPNTSTQQLSLHRFRLKKAIDNGNFVTWPGINEINFKKLLGTTIPLEKGHMDQERKNLRSTKDVDAEHDDVFPTLTNKKEYELYTRIVPASEYEHKHKAYSDQTG